MTACYGEMKFCTFCKYVEPMFSDNLKHIVVTQLYKCNLNQSEHCEHIFTELHCACRLYEKEEA
jgi:hypothetical protein